MRTLDDVVRSLAESVVFEYSKGGDPLELAHIRSAAMKAIRMAMPHELKAILSGGIHESLKGGL